MNTIPFSLLLHPPIHAPNCPPQSLNLTLTPNPLRPNSNARRRIQPVLLLLLYLMTRGCGGREEVRWPDKDVPADLEQ
ncbi:unnamed protein product [Sphenostylis stenocarpa]|uniref:Uncharacterized protein n=1 Tax=Sphenostylis stenocarpa TaxID=92480 RepID=A0AA86W1A9_9FABA|nr:unnamed protein product [Sphenostylis stenocarpa]